MSITAKAMEYEATPMKKTAIKSSAVLNHYGTPTILWHLVNRHKVGLLAAWAISVTTVQLFPFTPALLLSAIGK